jgi:protein O-GlcNAc transferase
VVETRRAVPYCLGIAWLVLSHASPALAQSAAERGRSLIRAGKLKEAELELKKSAQERGNTPEAQYDLARVVFATGNYAKSRAACQPLIAKDPKGLFSNLCMARAFLVWRRATRAVEYVDKARQAGPNNAEVFQVLGDLKRVEGDLAASKSAYREVLRIAPQDPDAHFGLGQLALIEQDDELAQREFRAVLAREPDWPEAAFELGRLSRGEEAVQLLQRALAARPKWPEARLALGTAKLENGDIPGAEALFREVLKATPNLAMAHSRLGMVLAAKREYPNAEAELKRGLAGLPNDPDAALALARVYARTDRPEDAFEAYRNAASLERSGSRALVEAGTYALQLSRNTLAQAFLEKALERTPKSATARARFADALLARGDKDKAKQNYRLALSGEGAIDRGDVQRRIDALP